MFKLTEDELQLAFEAIEHHGYSSMLPDPPEWQVFKNKWEEVKVHIANEDLDTYKPFAPLNLYAPKNRFNLRVVTHLHPQDLLIYTALVLIIKDDVEKERIPKNKKRVFSFRSSDKHANQLYQGKGSYERFKSELIRRAELKRCKYVAIADIADFYSRIYQHRLENVVQTVASSPRAEQVARVLVKKFLSNLAETKSYGIPVGPYASRPLAEALLIDVDEALLANGLNFVRWVDDYAFFAATETEAQYALFFLAKWLFDKHGLTLHGAKTKIMKVETFLDEHFVDNEDRLARHSEILKDLWGMLSPYEDDEVELDEAQRADLEAINFHDLLLEAIEDEDLVDYDMVSFLLGRVSRMEIIEDDWRHELVDIVIDNIHHFYPIADSVSRFFSSFNNLNHRDKKRVSKALLKPIVSPGKYPPPDYYVMWILNVFSGHESWNNADAILRIFQETQSEVVKRYAALALAVVGKRSHALVLKDNFNAASPLVKTAILKALKNLGDDELKHWKRSAMVSEFLEKRI